MPFDAFEVTPSAEGSNLEMKTGSFTDKENKLGEKVSQTLNDADKMLANMTKEMKSDLSADELKVAHLAMEQELENSIPSNFAKLYDSTETWADTADLVTAHILSTVNDFVNSYLSGGRSKHIAETIDDASWFGGMDASDVPSVFKKLGLTKGDAAVAQAKWNEPNISDDRLASIRREADAGSLLHQGMVASKNPGHRSQNRQRQLDNAMNTY